MVLMRSPWTKKGGQFIGATVRATTREQRCDLGLGPRQPDTKFEAGSLVTAVPERLPRTALSWLELTVAEPSSNSFGDIFPAMCVAAMFPS